MKILSLWLFALLYLLSACSPAPQPAPDPAPTDTAPTDTVPAPTRTVTLPPAETETPAPGYYTAPDGTFALQPPASWEPYELGREYPALVGPMLGILRANLLFVQAEAHSSVEMYAAAMEAQLMAALPQIEPIREDLLLTDDGQAYIRWEINNAHNDRALRQVLYFYGPGDWKLMITYTRPQAAGAENDPLVEAAMQTVHYIR